MTENEWGCMDGCGVYSHNPPPGRWTMDQIDAEIRRLYDKGFTDEEIAERLDYRSRNPIVRARKRMGLPGRGRVKDRGLGPEIGEEEEGLDDE